MPVPGGPQRPLGRVSSLPRALTSRTLQATLSLAQIRATTRAKEITVALEFIGKDPESDDEQLPGGVHRRGERRLPAARLDSHRPGDAHRVRHSQPAGGQ